MERVEFNRTIYPAQEIEKFPRLREIKKNGSDKGCLAATDMIDSLFYVKISSESVE